MSEAYDRVLALVKIASGMCLVVRAALPDDDGLVVHTDTIIV